MFTTHPVPRTTYCYPPFTNIPNRKKKNDFQNPITPATDNPPNVPLSHRVSSTPQINSNSSSSQPPRSKTSFNSNVLKYLTILQLNCNGIFDKAPEIAALPCDKQMHLAVF